MDGDFSAVTAATTSYNDLGIGIVIGAGRIEKRFEVLREAAKGGDIRRWCRLGGEGFGVGGDAAYATAIADFVGIRKSKPSIHQREIEREKGERESGYVKLKVIDMGRGVRQREL